ncbi:Lysosomal alpha-glucosidase [Trichoplax sp. H2]|nr:Lysosomal alpha-glucosidase [Trichoplax sp. H2]|eukprot:RDD41922.1 Lysosomal alpha-glucosidase [Trichoplax sp. H2]
MGEMSGRSKIVIGVVVAIVIMCAIIIPITVVVNGQRENIEATEPTQQATTTVPTQAPTSPTPTTIPVSNAPTCPSVGASERFDCFPDTDKQSKDVCEARGCCWIPTNVVGAPSCFFPPNYRTYTATEQSVPYGKKYTLTRNMVLPAHYGSPISSVNLDIQFQTSNRLRIKSYMWIHDGNSSFINLMMYVENCIRIILFRARVVSTLF